MENRGPSCLALFLTTDFNADSNLDWESITNKPVKMNNNNRNKPRKQDNKHIVEHCTSSF